MLQVQSCKSSSSCRLTAASCCHQSSLQIAWAALGGSGLSQAAAADEEMQELKRLQVNFCIPDKEVAQQHNDTFGRIMRAVRSGSSGCQHDSLDCHPNSHAHSLCPLLSSAAACGPGLVQSDSGCRKQGDGRLVLGDIRTAARPS